MASWPNSVMKPTPAEMREKIKLRSASYSPGYCQTRNHVEILIRVSHLGEGMPTTLNKVSSVLKKIRTAKTEMLLEQ